LYYCNSYDFHDFNYKFGYNYREDFIDLCLNTTLEISEKCNFDFEMGIEKYPKYEPTEEIINLCGSSDSVEIIKKIAFSNLKRKLKKYKENKIVEITDEKALEYVNRLNYEISVIDSKKMLDYFLVNWELIKDYREHGFDVGPGRGSACGCLLTWCLNITKIDPIRFGLYFERFLNPTRKCITESNDVLMKNGKFKNIMEITLDDKFNIQTKTGIGELVEIIDREVESHEDVYQIETADGSIVELTAGHMVPVFRNGEEIEIRVDEIKNDDFLITF
jgi:hypothetical protein